MAGESEAKVTLEQTRTCYARLPHPLKKLSILTAEEGGATHCQVDNLPLLNRMIFDWLNGIIEEEYSPTICEPPRTTRANRRSSIAFVVPFPVFCAPPRTRI